MPHLSRFGEDVVHRRPPGLREPISSREEDSGGDKGEEDGSHEGKHTLVKGGTMGAWTHRSQRISLVVQWTKLKLPPDTAHDATHCPTPLPRGSGRPTASGNPRARRDG